MPEKKKYNVQGFLEKLNQRSGKKVGMIDNERPRGTPPPPGSKATSKKNWKETGVEVKRPDGSKEFVDPEEFKRKSLRTLREGGEVSESTKKAIKEKHPITQKPIQEIRLIGDHKVRVINRKSQLGRRRRRNKDPRIKRLRDNTGGAHARRDLYRRMGFVSQETGKEGMVPGRKKS